VGDNERFEQLIAFLGSNLPTPVDEQAAGDGSILFTGGAPPEVVVHLTETSVIVSEYAGVWTSADHFTVKPRRIGLVKWGRLPETSMLQALAALIRGAREARLGRYRTCPACGKRRPPEALVADGVCLMCDDEPPPVVH
jgi:hypothetical protein